MPLEPSSKRRHRRCSYRYLHHVRHLVIPPLPDRLGQRNRHRAGPVRRRGRAKRLHPAPRPDAGASAQRRSHLRADRRRVHLRQRFRAAGADGLVPLADDRRAVVRRRLPDLVRRAIGPSRLDGHGRLGRRARRSAVAPRRHAGRAGLFAAEPPFLARHGGGGLIGARLRGRPHGVRRRRLHRQPAVAGRAGHRLAPVRPLLRQRLGLAHPGRRHRRGHGRAGGQPGHQGRLSPAFRIRAARSDGAPPSLL
ncbi:hypothetical protein G6F35_014019 [Rhizopus arrhizus]|nr:hypothetical protein G6F35_014019 [Rhizopus arrhizus]